MPVMKSMSIIIAYNPSVIALENLVVDIRQIVANYATMLIFPDFSAQYAVSIP